MNKSQIIDLVSKLSSDAFAYFFPGGKQPEIIEEPPVMFRVSKPLEIELKRNGSLVFEELMEVVCEPLGETAEDDEQELDAKTQALLDEIKALQEKYGVTIDEIEAVLSYTVKLSRLRITYRHEIILEDYDRREVKMDTLTKAVFLLFLKHPEGIRFKELFEHRKELEDIYMSISGRSDLEAMKKSIDDLTNPSMNSISEKVSKARKAFRNVVEERIAKFYYIDGKSGEPKKIVLDRSLVIWE